MRIGVISDTHDRLPTFEQALSDFTTRGVEAIFHAGDFVAPFAAKLLAPHAQEIPVYCIYGNNDGEREGLARVLPQLQDGTLRVEIGGRRIAMHHYVDWFTREDHRWAEVLISGHDHTPDIRKRDGRLYLNPGECCGWVTGRCTVAVLETQPLEAELIELTV